MEAITLKVEVEPELFAKLYARYGEKTTDVVRDCLHQLVESSPSDTTSGSPPKIQKTKFQYWVSPGPETKTGKVWEIASKQRKEEGEATRESVVETCIEAGIEEHTARTHFYHWEKLHGVMAFQDQTLMDNDREKLTDKELVKLWHETNKEALHLNKKNANGEFQYVKDIRRHFNQKTQGHGRRDKRGNIDGRPETLSQPYDTEGKKYWYSERWKRACQQDS